MVAWFLSDNKLEEPHCLFAHIQSTACWMAGWVGKRNSYYDWLAFLLHFPENQMCLWQPLRESFFFFFSFTGKSVSLSLLHVEAIRSIIQGLKTWSRRLSHGEVCRGKGLCKMPKLHVQRINSVFLVSFYCLKSTLVFADAVKEQYFTNIILSPGTVRRESLL